MAKAGATMLVIGSALGYSMESSSITGIYARLDMETVREAMERTVKAMLDAIKSYHLIWEFR